jgi:hypothetical protein|tara:strand:+ start:889 stop:1182 length:294 start_codon:yes stop_codon:yes gene_type:complete
MDDFLLMLVFYLLIPLLYVRLTKSDSINYGLIIILAILGFIADGGIGGLGFSLFAVIISLVSFLKKSWSISKTLEKSLKVLIVLTLVVAIGKLAGLV